MNWQTVLVVYCIWSMAMSLIGLIMNIRHTRRHFEQGEKMLSIKDPIQQKQEKILDEIEKQLIKTDKEIKGRPKNEH